MQQEWRGMLGGDTCCVEEGKGTKEQGSLEVLWATVA